MNSSVRQGLTADISKDALELTIEEITDVGIKKVTYKAEKTEAIVQLDDFVIFDSEKHCTISGRKVNIVAITPKHMPNLYAETPKERPEERPVVPVVRAVPTTRVSAVKAEKPTAPVVRAKEKPVVSRNRAVNEDGIPVVARCSEDDPKETTGVVKFPAVKRDLLVMLLSDSQTLLPNCSFKMVTEGIELKGPAKAVAEARLNISEQVFRFKVSTIEGNSQRVRLMQSDKSQQQVQELFLKAGIQVVLSVRDDKLLLTAADDEQKSQASRVLERNLHRSEIPVDDFHQEFLQSAQWKELIKDLERNYTVTVERETSSVVIDALGDCSEDVLKQVRDKLEDNAQQSDDIHLTEEEWQLLKTYHQTEVEDLCMKTG